VADAADQILFEKHRVIACDRGDHLELITAVSATLTPDQVLELSDFLRRWATRLVPVGKPR
jgi:hypothetical protein